MQYKKPRSAAAVVSGLRNFLKKRLTWIKDYGTLAPVVNKDRRSWPQGKMVRLSAFFMLSEIIATIYDERRKQDSNG